MPETGGKWGGARAVKILMLTDRYPPELRSSATLFHDLARALQARSHEVRVITKVPSKYTGPDGVQERLERCRGSPGSARALGAVSSRRKGGARARPLNALAGVFLCRARVAAGGCGPHLFAAASPGPCGRRVSLAVPRAFCPERPGSLPADRR